MGEKIVLVQRPLGKTGMSTASLALGLVKLGRASDVKYPTPVKIPTDREALALLRTAQELGINLLDTAPAYGNSEQRLGKLIKEQRQDWLVCTKVGETYDEGRSSYDFSPAATRSSVERSLVDLQTDYLDIVLIHSDGSDLEILQQNETLAELKRLQTQGKVRAIGISHKTVQGAELAISLGVDVLMATLNPAYTDELNVIAQAAEAGVGVLIKKALASGHGATADLAWVNAQPGVSSIVVGTTNPAHLRENASVLAG